MAANQPLAAQQTGAPISRSKGSDPIESALATSAHLQVAVRGLRCAACVTRLQDTLRADPNVMDAQVNLATERASIHYASDQPQTPARLGAAASASGFDLLPLRNGADDDSGALDEAALAEQDHAQARRDTKLLVLAVLCSLPLALQMVGMGLGQPWHLPYWLELALATPVQFVVGATFYLGAWHALSARSTNMDVLVALGSSAAYGYSVWLVVTEGSMATGQLYFEASALILTLIYAGKLLERHARQRTSAALKALQALAPETANLVLADGTAEHTVTKVLVANLQLGQLLVVHPGERIPADGVIESGASDVDESMLTGESVAVARNPGDMVVGGSLNGAGNLQVRVAALGPDATLGRIAAMVEAAAAGTAPVQQLVDKVSAWFVPAVLVIAAATAAGWWLAGADFGSGLIAAVAVLVIACPCALGLATPTAIVAGTGAAARAGILVKNVAAMERANAVQFVYFDKTGTLTHGRPRITAEHCVSGQTPDNCLLLAASVEAASEHPLRHAFAEAAAKRGLAMHSALEFRALAGRGIKARCNGQDIVVGNSRLMRETGIQLETADEFAPLAPGSSRVFIGCDAMLIGAFDVADELRPDAANTLQRLGAQGIEVGILSGDASLVVNATAAELGPNIDAHAEMLPADKAEYLAELRHGGRIVAFVGDGVNDAPALASADIGIAIGGATDVAIETADITLLRPEPTLVLAALEISRRTVAKIAQNLFWACGYNVVCIPLAAFGFLSPALAGAAMAASSISVVVNSLALARWRPV